MKPQPAKGNLVDEPEQIVGPFRVGDLMDEDCVELPVAQQTLDSERQADVRAQDAVDRRALPGRGKGDWDAICQEATLERYGVAAVCRPFVTEVPVQAHQEPRRH